MADGTGLLITARKVVPDAPAVPCAPVATPLPGTLDGNAPAHDQLLERLTLVRAISETSRDVVYAKDLQGRMRYANPAALALIGRPPGLGQSVGCCASGYGSSDCVTGPMPRLEQCG